ncbi:hypothetical protein [Shimia sp. MIT910701]|uniref:hypothetical protein n=1 Tax=Shimia sp. MIT910701 TaxID=3096987 RepID=UPI00399A7C01
MSQSKLIGMEALDLTSELLADLELDRLPLSSCVMKAARLARLTGDMTFLRVFQYEQGGYPTSPAGVSGEVWEFCKLAGRVYKYEKKGKGDSVKVEERANLDPIDALEGKVESSRLRMEFGRPQPVSVSSANPRQYVGAPSRNVVEEKAAERDYHSAKRDLASRKSFVFDYVLTKHFELRVSSASEDIFDIHRIRIDEHLSSIVPDELRKLDSISDNLKSDNAEDWANAAHSCRRLLQAVADAIFPPAKAPYKTKLGKDVKVGKDNYINRLVCFCDENMDSATAVKIIGSDLSFIGERLDAVFSGVQKGSHADISLSEARRFVIHTYLVVGDILELHTTADLQGQKLTAEVDLLPETVAVEEDISVSESD